MQGGRLACAVGSKDGEHLARGHGELHTQIALGDNGAQLQLAHGRYLVSVPVSRRAPSPSTTNAATATSTIDNATAAFALVTRCR